MDVVATESSKFNNVPPPPDFKTKNAWEVSEIVLVGNKLFEQVMQSPPTPTKPKYYRRIDGPSRYLVEDDLLGEGGISKVHRAWDLRLGKYVVVKELQGYLIDDKDFYKSIELEAKTMARLNHPGIPIIYGFSLVNKEGDSIIPVMIMERFKEQNLFERLNRIKPLKAKKVIDIISQTASTLEYLNRQGVMHGDVKPKNIILGKHHIKLLDFGNSNWINPEGPLGFTEAYTAPEMKFTPTSDVYSLAATALVMVYGFDDEYVGLNARIKNLPSTESPFYRFHSDNKKRLVAILLKGLAEDPQERYKSPLEFAEDFKSAFRQATLIKKPV